VLLSPDGKTRCDLGGVAIGWSKDGATITYPTLMMSLNRAASRRRSRSSLVDRMRRRSRVRFRASSGGPYVGLWQVANPDEGSLSQYRSRLSTPFCELHFFSSVARSINRCSVLGQKRTKPSKHLPYLSTVSTHTVVGPCNEHELVIARIVDDISIEGRLVAMSIQEVTAALKFMMSRSDSEFLVHYTKWRVEHPAIRKPSVPSKRYFAFRL
jgi:hypothetical protein